MSSSISAQFTAYSLSGLLVLAAIHTKECAMHDFLSLRAADLSRLAMTIQTHLDSAEDTTQSINHSLIVKRR
jgi:hypothetical protein